MDKSHKLHYVANVSAMQDFTAKSSMAIRKAPDTILDLSSANTDFEISGPRSGSMDRGASSIATGGQGTSRGLQTIE